MDIGQIGTEVNFTFRTWVIFPKVIATCTDVGIVGTRIEVMVDCKANQLFVYE